ncbi:reverse transcriptase domain-containing protein [Tanacetum coccineum]
MVLAIAVLRYSFTPENQKKFCQFIKGVKLPDGFGSCFKHKVTDNDTNITGLKSHDYHIMMQRLLPYGLQNYLPDKIAKPIIELCSLFKQICSAALIEDDMLNAHIKVVDKLCDLELIYPPALFDIMIHLVIHLPLEALEGGPIRPRLFPNKDMKVEFPDWFGSQIRQRHIDNDKDPDVSTTSELFALACGPIWTPISINSCVVDDVRYVVHSRDERRTTQNSGICAPGPDGEMSYGQLQEILEFKYLSFKVALFRVKWFDTRNNGRVKKLTFRNGMTQIIGSGEWWKNDQYILATQVKQVFYLEDPAKPNVKVVEHVNHKKFFNRGVIVVENDSFENIMDETTYVREKWGRFEGNCDGAIPKSSCRTRLVLMTITGMTMRTCQCQGESCMLSVVLPCKYVSLETNGESVLREALSERHHSYLLVSMGEFFHDDICEQILVRLDVEDLIRYKSVCKSWKSLISHPRFVKAHQKRQVNLIPYRMGIIPNYLSKYGAEHYMVGSSNGLACINSFDGDEIIVANPWTREERMLQKLPVSPERSCCVLDSGVMYRLVLYAMGRYTGLDIK